MKTSAFQKSIAGDLRNMLRFFGRRRRFEGRNIWMAEHAAETKTGPEAVGIQGNTLTLICETRSLPCPPKPGAQHVSLDGDWWHVLDVSRPPGLVVLHLERASS